MKWPGKMDAHGQEWRSSLFRAKSFIDHPDIYSTTNLSVKSHSKTHENLYTSLGLSGYSDGLQAGQLRFNSWQGQGIFLCCAVSRRALGPTQSAM
jgi:hypothetical protein